MNHYPYPHDFVRLTTIIRLVESRVRDHIVPEIGLVDYVRKVYEDHDSHFANHFELTIGTRINELHSKNVKQWTDEDGIMFLMQCHVCFLLALRSDLAYHLNLEEQVINSLKSIVRLVKTNPSVLIPFYWSLIMKGALLIDSKIGHLNYYYELEGYQPIWATEPFVYPSVDKLEGLVNSMASVYQKFQSR